MSEGIRDPLLRRTRAVGTVVAGMIYVFLLLPLVVTLPMAFSPANGLTFPPTSYSLDLFRTFFTSPDWLEPLYQSVKVALATTAISMLAGVPSAYWIARQTFWGKKLITGAIMSPLVLPSVVLALGLYLYFSYLRIHSSTLSLTVAHVIVILPFVILMTSAGVHKLDRNLEFGAELMGAGPIRIFLTVVLPQLVPSLVSGAFFSFLLSFDELTLSWFLCDPNTITLPVRMYGALNWEASPVIAAASTLMTVLSLIVCAVAVLSRKAVPVDGQ